MAEDYRKPDGTVCEHEEFNTWVTIGRHKVKEDGPVVAFTAEFKLECRDCGAPFRFASDLAMAADRLSIKMSVRPGNGTFIADEMYVPGNFRCPECHFTCSSNLLSATTGQVAANREAQPEPCPNDGTLMVRVTYKEIAEQWATDGVRLMRDLRALQNAWPEGHAMPEVMS